MEGEVADDGHAADWRHEVWHSELHPIMRPQLQSTWGRPQDQKNHLLLVVPRDENLDRRSDSLNLFQWNASECAGAPGSGEWHRGDAQVSD